MSDDALQPGLRFDDRYSIISRIGGGSFGVVCSAFDLVRGREVAIKVLRKSALDSPELVRRFEREAEICAQLSNPHTARLHGFSQASVGDDGAAIPYMVFDLVRGLPLGVLMRHRGNLNVQETAHILVGVLDSLEEAHRLGIIHRDLKPDNILCVPPAGSFRKPQATGEIHQLLGVPPLGAPCWDDLTNAWVRVVDFGLGKILEIDDRKVKPLTKAGMAAGTANYMSPEQLLARPIDYRSDIYGVAMLLHRLLVGKETFYGRSVAEVAMHHVKTPLPDLPREYDGHLISEIFQRAGSKVPDERYPAAAEMAHDLRLVLDPTLGELPQPAFDRPPEVRSGSGISEVVKKLFRGS